MSRSRFTSRSSVSPSPRCLQRRESSKAAAVSADGLCRRSARGALRHAHANLACCKALACEAKQVLHHPGRPTTSDRAPKPLAPAARPAARRHCLGCGAFQPAAALLLLPALLPPIAAAWLRAAGLRGRGAGHPHAACSAGDCGSAVRCDEGGHASGSVSW